MMWERSPIERYVDAVGNAFSCKYKFDFHIMADVMDENENLRMSPEDMT
jgi:hypothetical protein